VPAAPNVPASAPAHPVGGQSPLDIVSADSGPSRATDDPTLIPPKSNRPNSTGGPLASAPGVGTPPAPRRPVEPSAAGKNLVDLQALVAESGAAWRAIDTYETVATRREMNPKGSINNEVVLSQFRREPMSVYTLNLSESGKGREMIYYPAKFEDKLHVKLGKGDPFPGAGFVAPPISPDDPRVKAKARYSVREAGFGRPIAALAAAVAQLEAGTIPGDAVRYDGEVNREEFPRPVVGVTHRLRPGDDPVMPLGGTRQYFFDMKKGSPAYGMPVLIIATEPSGQGVEYYLYERVKQPAGLTDANFDPARLKKK
jgi:hypothetical protein